MHDNKSSRPHWTQSVRGVPFECVARLHPERKLIRPDLQVHPHRVSLVRTGQAHAKSYVAAQPLACRRLLWRDILVQNVVPSRLHKPCSCYECLRRRCLNDELGCEQRHGIQRTAGCPCTLSTQLYVCREDVYELSYCYNASATNEDVFKRSLEPYVDRLIDGYNVNVVAFGTTGSGKRLLLDGTQHGAPSDTGIVQHAIDDIFRKLHASSIKASSCSDFAFATSRGCL